MRHAVEQERRVGPAAACTWMRSGRKGGQAQGRTVSEQQQAREPAGEHAGLGRGRASNNARLA